MTSLAAQVPLLRQGVEPPGQEDNDAETVSNAGAPDAEDAEDAEDVAQSEAEEEDQEDQDELEACRQQVVERFNACCPFDVRLHRNVDPNNDAWEAECHARAIGMRWNKVNPTVFCEWPVGSGEVYPQGELSYQFLLIYAKASGTFTGDVKRPNAWRELHGCMEHIEAPTEEDESGEAKDPSASGAEEEDEVSLFCV
jgi:hypothetical protein